MTVKLANGGTETVMLRVMPIRHLQEYVQAVSKLDEARKVELYCGKPVGWADTLHMDSVKEISEAGWELNRDDFFWFLRAQTELATKVSGGPLLPGSVSASISQTSP